MVCEINKDEAYQLIAADQQRASYREFRYSDAGQYAPRRASPLVDRRRRSDAGWQQNNSDPALSKHRYFPTSITLLDSHARATLTQQLSSRHSGGYTEYDSSTSADHAYGEPLQDPRVRRMRWGSIKSRSYDYADTRRRVPPPDDYDHPPSSRDMRSYPRGAKDHHTSDRDLPSDYERDRSR